MIRANRIVHKTKMLKKNNPLLTLQKNRIIKKKMTIMTIRHKTNKNKLKISQIKMNRKITQIKSKIRKTKTSNRTIMSKTMMKRKGSDFTINYLAL
jgi:hypothetical protein